MFLRHLVSNLFHDIKQTFDRMHMLRVEWAVFIASVNHRFVIIVNMWQYFNQERKKKD